MREVLATDLTEWSLGPYHPALPGPVRLWLALDGEVVVRARLERGFLHRGLEKAFESQRWMALGIYADRLDPECASFGELVVCRAIEEIVGVVPPARAAAIRMILCELTRIGSHLGFLARMARSVGADTAVHYVLREREKILDLFELLTGARFALNFVRVGGVAADVTEGFIERVLEVCELLRIRTQEYNDILSYNHGFMRRTVGLGIVTPERAKAFGLTGPNARASGIGYDVRRDAPYEHYSRLDFQVPVATTTGDVHERFILRLREINASLEILKQLVDSVPPGDFSILKPERSFRVPSGEAYVRVESPRGVLGCHLVSDGRDKPYRVNFNVPSTAALELLPEVLRGASIADIPVILASFDLSMPEVDR